MLAKKAVLTPMQQVGQKRTWTDFHDKGLMALADTQSTTVAGDISTSAATTHKSPIVTEAFYSNESDSTSTSIPIEAESEITAPKKLVLEGKLVDYESRRNSRNKRLTKKLRKMKEPVIKLVYPRHDFG